MSKKSKEEKAAEKAAKAAEKAAKKEQQNANAPDASGDVATNPPAENPGVENDPNAPKVEPPEVSSENAQEDDIPTVEAVGMVRTPNGWCALKVTFRDDKVLKIEPQEPNLKAIAQQEAKILFSKTFLMGE